MLSSADSETQLDVMEAWFRQNFEDPANRTPYESAEGGYIWIWGGPYDARDQLQNEFDGIVPENLIGQLAEELSTECWEWAPTPSADDFDSFLVHNISQITEYYHHFLWSIIDITQLLRMEVDDDVSSCFLRLLYANVITALETYLSDAFISSVLNRKELLRRYVECAPLFRNQKVCLSEVYTAYESIEQRVSSHLAEVAWHNLDRVKPMYRDTLGIEFPSDLGEVYRAILIRHDIVHRNGKTKSGDDIQILPEDVKKLIDEIERFVKHIDANLSKLTPE